MSNDDQNKGAPKEGDSPTTPAEEGSGKQTFEGRTPSGLKLIPVDSIQDSGLDWEFDTNAEWQLTLDNESGQFRVVDEQQKRVDAVAKPPEDEDTVVQEPEKEVKQEEQATESPAETAGAEETVDNDEKTVALEIDPAPPAEETDTQVGDDEEEYDDAKTVALELDPAALTDKTEAPKTVDEEEYDDAKTLALELDPAALTDKTEAPKTVDEEEYDDAKTLALELDPAELARRAEGEVVGTDEVAPPSDEYDEDAVTVALQIDPADLARRAEGLPGEGSEGEPEEDDKTVLLDVDGQPAGVSEPGSEEQETVLLDQAGGAAASQEPVLFADAAQESMLPEVGDRVLDRYEIVRELGKGGFATVYEAIDLNIESPVALKIMHAEQSFDESLAKRFKQEVTLVRQLHHPNTIKITDAGATEKGSLFMVAELLSGVSLEEFVSQTGPVLPGRATHITLQILKSLAEAHEMGIVHRDLKPANVMIGTIGGEEDAIKVLDFGIAKALGNELASVHTKTGFVFCTPQYAPPEILLARGVTPAADIYSLGLITLELLLGKKVIALESQAESIAFGISDDPVPVPVEIADTPFGRILAKATAKKTEDRYADASGMLEDLEALDPTSLPTEPLSIGALDTVILDGRYDSTLPLPPGAAAGIHGDPTRPVEDGTLRLEQPPQRRSRAPLILALLGILGGLALVLWYANPNRGGDQTDEADTTESSMLDQPDAGVLPRALSAQEILEARLAASDWRTGSWLEDSALLASADLALTGEAVRALQIALLDDPRQAAELTRIALLYESAQTNSDALALLDSAEQGGHIQDDEREAASRERLDRTANLVVAMAELGRCDPAEQQMQETLGGLGEVPSDFTGVVTEMETAVSHCRTAEGDHVWHAGDYLTLVRRAEELDEQVADLSPEDTGRRPLLYQSLHARESAVVILEVGLEDSLIPEENIADARQDLRDLTDHIIRILLELDLVGAAESRIAQRLQDSENLEESDAAELAQVRNQLEDEARSDTQAEIENAPEVAPIGEGTGATATGSAAWRRYNQLASAGDDLLDQARATQPDLPDKEIDDSEIASVDSTEGQEIEGDQETETQRPVRNVALTLTTNPRGVRVYVDGQFVGRSPVEHTLSSSDESVEIMLRKTDFDTYRLVVSMLEPVAQHHVTLNPTNPFGHTSTMGGRNR